MGKVTKLVAATSLLAMAVLLFVVVCPATPTPTAVVQSRTAAPAITVGPVGPAILFAVAIVTAVLVRFERAQDSSLPFQPLPVLARTCVFLC